MLGIIIYEVFDILYHVGKLGYNCIDYGVSIVYGKKQNEHLNSLINQEENMYLERIIKLEKRLHELENEKIKQK